MRLPAAPYGKGLEGGHQGALLAGRGLFPEQMQIGEHGLHLRAIEDGVPIGIDEAKMLEPGSGRLDQANEDVPGILDSVDDRASLVFENHGQGH